ncbi:MAG: ribosome silencing factor [Candidatus Schekmanbacteria bacterium]|nr:MAG: ribosome silencing factor [Candidatus Schekmanbacteria bacterium]
MRRKYIYKEGNFLGKEPVKKIKKKRSESLTSKQIVLKAAEFALEKKALDPVLYDVRKITSIADYFFICHGSSDKNVKSIAENIVEEFKKRGIYAISVDGFLLCQWIVIDYGDVVIHIFQKETRDYYNLEGIWGDAKTLKIPA